MKKNKKRLAEKSFEACELLEDLDEFVANIRRYVQEKDMCVNLTDTLTLAEHFAKQELPSDPLELVIVQRNRLFNILLSLAMDAPQSEEGDISVEGDRLYNAVRAIVSSGYEEGANIFDTDVNPHSTWPNTEIYKKVAAMVIEEKKRLRAPS